ncbi:MAG: lysophospholipid acyltransferase family protein [Phycisphaerae bacterium]|nr:lysophospholipid acyltransferase family protein [Phycisphaerae bacterium]
MPGAALIPARPNWPVRRVFAWHAEGMLRRRFAAVRMVAGAAEVLAPLAAQSGPALIVMSHASWWDPIVGAFLWRRFFPARDTYAPMDADQLQQFRFMRRLGMFGIDPNDHRSMPAMLRYLDGVRDSSPHMLLMITPEGRFTDPRVPLLVRPGAAAVAARLGVRSAVAVAVEYAFWTDAKPEVFLRAVAIPVPARPTASAWQGAIGSSMQANRELLAQRVMRREPAGFIDAITTRARIHPVYDAWLALTGRRSAIRTAQRASATGEAAS